MILMSKLLLIMGVSMVNCGMNQPAIFPALIVNSNDLRSANYHNGKFEKSRKRNVETRCGGTRIGEG
jgi:hypothetical protein